MSAGALPNFPERGTSPRFAGRPAKPAVGGGYVPTLSLVVASLCR